MKINEELNTLPEEAMNGKAMQLTENEMEQVTGGSVAKTPDYLYDTKAIKNTQFLDGVPNTQYDVWKLADISVGERVRVASDVVYTDYLQRPYLKCFKKIDTIVEGYVLATDLAPRTI